MKAIDNTMNTRMIWAGQLKKWGTNAGKQGRYLQLIAVTVTLELISQFWYRFKRYGRFLSSSIVVKIKIVNVILYFCHHFNNLLTKEHGLMQRWKLSGKYLMFKLIRRRLTREIFVQISLSANSRVKCKNHMKSFLFTS